MKDKISIEELQNLEKELASQSSSLGPDFSVRVMEKIEERSSMLYKLMEVVKMSSTVLSGRRLAAVAGVCTLVFCFAFGIKEFADVPHQAAFSVKTDSSKYQSQNTRSLGESSKIKESFPSDRNRVAEEALIQNVPTVAADIKKTERFAAGKDASSLMRAEGLSQKTNQGFSGMEMNDLIAAPGIPAGRHYLPPHYPQVHSRENYGQYEENPRILVSKEPKSTFSIDVDTASYTNARRYIRMGQLPPSDSVRIEEFINYFNYDYPSQSSEPFGVHYEIAPSPFSDGRHLLKLGIKAKDIAKDENKPWNLVFLIDVSGSMGTHDKLPLLKRSLKLLVDKMKPSDKLGIVTYSGGVGVALEPTSGSEKEKITRVIDSLHSGGGTYGSGGINAAYDLLSKNFNKEAINRVVLASDGDFNVGVTSFGSLVKLIEEKRKTGIFLTTLGFGTGNLNDQNMEQLANKGNGSYYYIDSFREARKVLETGLTSNMDVVAKDVKLQIEFNPANVLEYRLVGYDNRKLRNQDFANDKIDAGEIGAGHTVTAIYEVVLAESKLAKDLQGEFRYEANKAKVEVPTGSAKELAFLKIRYKEANSDTSKPLSYEILKNEVKDNLDAASADYRFAVAVSSFAEALRDGSHGSDVDLKKVLEIAKANKGSDDFGYRQEFIELVRDAISIRGSRS